MTGWLKAAKLPMHVQQNKGLHPFGYSIAIKGLALRAHGSSAAGQKLWAYFHPNGISLVSWNLLGVSMLDTGCLVIKVCCSLSHAAAAAAAAVYKRCGDFCA